MSRFHFTFGLIFGFILTANAQFVERTTYDNFKLFNEDEVADYEGSPYLFEGWKKIEASINGKTYNYDEARYNLYQDILEFKVKGDHRYIEGSILTSFKIAGKLTYYIRNSGNFNSKYIPKGLLQISVIGDQTIVTVYKSLLRKPSKENPLLLGVENKGRMIIKTENFIVTDKTTKINKNKDLYRLFPGESKRLKAFIKSESPDLKSHEGLFETIYRVFGK